jgi:serine/threonine-protein kinase
MASNGADRDLLFGLLALQNGLIDQAKLVAAFQAWTLDKGRPMADHLAGRGALDADDRALVEALVERHARRHGGVSELSLWKIAVGPSTRKSLAALGDPEIEQTLTQLAPDSYVDADGALSYAAAASDGRRFRILRPHARGGLGAVFVALDGELNREVALKQILEDHADDPASRARFLLEAEIAGGLEHPGIVPVYSLGTYADGRPYYAMRFIRGDSLKEAVDRFHADHPPRSDDGRRALERNKLLRRFLDVCNAIEYAHSRGVLHRDIKPANIIVGKHGETLVVDWGLAKATGFIEPASDSGERTLVPSSGSGGAETLPGSAIGTPSYMSPEQAGGDLESIGPRSDVYSLGATLYYLLAGRSPFAGEFAGVEEVLRAVQRGEFPPPRRLDATIDRALEAVCLKAMARRPEDRYGSAAALSEDIERWMADEPVSAWREPIARRARRWARRNRTAMTAAAATLIAGVVGLSAILLVQTQAKAEIARALGREMSANVALAAANDALSRSKAAVQARYDLAVDAIQTFHTGVSQDFLLKEEKFKELRNRLLRSASDFYGRLGALLGQETDLGSRRALARANFELAALIGLVGRTEDALAAHRSVLAARRALAARSEAGAAEQAEVGRSLNAVANLLEGVGKIDEALSSFREAEALLAGPAAESSDARATLAACRNRMGSLLARIGESGQALAAFRLARSDQEALAAAGGATSQARLELADTINNIGNVFKQTGRMAQAEAEYREALAIRRELDEAHPGVVTYRLRRAQSHRNLAMLLGDTGRPAEAEAEHRASLEIRRKLAEENPAVADFRAGLAAGHAGLGIHLAQTGRPEQAEAEFRAAVAIQRELADENPTVNAFRSSLANAHHDLGYLLAQTGRMADAESEYRAAMAIQRELAGRNPAVTDYRRDLANTHANVGELLSQTGRPAEAESEYREAVAIQRKLREENPLNDAIRSDLAQSHDIVGFLLSTTGRPAEAEAAYREALAIRQEMVKRNPTLSDHRDALAGGHTNLADVVRSLGRPAEARDGYDRAIAIGEALAREVPESTTYRSHLAGTLRRRGLARRDLGDPAGAVADARRALGIYDGLESRSGEEWYETACCHAALAGLAGSAGLGVSAGEGPAEADRTMERLRRAVAMGYRDPDAFRTEPALSPLRGREDFRLLLMDLSMPSDPFGRRE